MPARVQGLKFGLGLGKQANISTAGSTFITFRKLNMDLTTPRYNTENDEDEIGKGNEFATQVFPVAKDVSNRIEKYASAEFVTWAVAYGLGNVAYAGGIYTLTPIDIGSTLELPYFTLCEQLAEGGGEAIDNLFVGCALEEWSLAFNYGAGRQSAKMTASFAGSGLVTTPSAVTLPSVQSEHYMLSQSMSLVINGTDYVAAKTILNGTLGWKNNLSLNAGYYPGSGLQNNAAVRGRIEVGKRMPTFTFTVRLLHNSPEYAALVAQTTGTAVLTIQYDASHTVTFTLEQLSYSAVELTEADGVVAVTVTGKPQFNNSTGILSVSAQCGIVGIAQ